VGIVGITNPDHGCEATKVWKLKNEMKINSCSPSKVRALPRGKLKQ
jgi:hypothetical protein